MASRHAFSRGENRVNTRIFFSFVPFNINHQVYVGWAGRAMGTTGLSYIRLSHIYVSWIFHYKSYCLLYQLLEQSRIQMGWVWHGSRQTQTYPFSHLLRSMSDPCCCGFIDMCCQTCFVIGTCWVWFDIVCPLKFYFKIFTYEKKISCLDCDKNLTLVVNLASTTLLYLGQDWHDRFKEVQCIQGFGQEQIEMEKKINVVDPNIVWTRL